MKSVTSLVLKKESQYYSLRFLRKAPTKNDNKAFKITLISNFHKNATLSYPEKLNCKSNHFK